MPQGRLDQSRVIQRLTKLLGLHEHGGMRSHLMTIAVAATSAVAVGLLTVEGWPGYVVGAVFALSLWLMLFSYSFAAEKWSAVPPVRYAGASALAIAIGYVFFRLGADNPVWWAPGFIMAGAIMAGSSSLAGTSRRSGQTGERG